MHTTVSDGTDTPEAILAKVRAAGSDYHGTNKLIELGDTGLQSDTEWPFGLRRFLTDTGLDPLGTD